MSGKAPTLVPLLRDSITWDHSLKSVSPQGSVELGSAIVLPFPVRDKTLVQFNLSMLCMGSTKDKLTMKKMTYLT